MKAMDQLKWFDSIASTILSDGCLQKGYVPLSWLFLWNGACRGVPVGVL